MRDETNIILIVMDTLRKDYARLMENTLKDHGFVQYENVISPSPWTLPAHASIFSGLYPALHGAHETRNIKNPNIMFKPSGLNTIYSQLQDIGYTTYLLSANPYITPAFGFNGFDYFYDTYTGKYSVFFSEKDQEEFDLLKSKYQTGAEIGRALARKGQYALLFKALAGILLWKSRLIRSTWPFDMGANRTIKLIKKLPLDQHQPFFLFMNLMETHEPYHHSENPTTILKSFMDNLASGRLNWEQIALWRKVYPEEVRYLTTKVFELLSTLKEKRVLDNSMIIITSDHGQLIGDHGRIGHGVFLYDELIRVPLLIKYPKTLEALAPKEDTNKGYISLTNLKRFIFEIVSGSDNRTSLFSPVAFSETYGIQDKPTLQEYSENEKKNLLQLEKYKIAVYYNGAKGIFNVTDWKFENISIHSPEDSIEDIITPLKREVLRFLKSASALKQIKKQDHS